MDGWGKVDGPNATQWYGGSTAWRPPDTAVILAIVHKWWAHQDLNLRPIDYEDVGGSIETLIRGRIVRSSLDADFPFEAVRTYIEPSRLVSSHQAVQPQELQVIS